MSQQSYEPYNPLDKSNLGTSVADALLVCRVTNRFMFGAIGIRVATDVYGYEGGTSSPFVRYPYPIRRAIGSS